jgi:hypothetical protein
MENFLLISSYNSVWSWGLETDSNGAKMQIQIHGSWEIILVVVAVMLSSTIIDWAAFLCLALESQDNSMKMKQRIWSEVLAIILGKIGQVYITVC